MLREKRKAVAYLRTSSAANVGQDKDSAQRQRAAIAVFAKREGFEVVDEFNDEAVSGADAIEARPGFAALLDRIEGNGVRVVLVEDASRFARHVLVQELGVMALQQRGVQVFTASGDELTATDDPSKVMVRQMMAAFAQFEKARLVGKLAAARKRKREATGKCEGRKGHAELRPDVVDLVRKMHRKTKAGRMSLRAIAAELATQGHVNERGQPFNPKSVAVMLAA
jgi:DNA invertase Pin-like site-specific DNA recombinase